MQETNVVQTKVMPCSRGFFDPQVDAENEFKGNEEFMEYGSVSDSLPSLGEMGEEWMGIGEGEPCFSWEFESLANYVSLEEELELS